VTFIQGETRDTMPGYRSKPEFGLVLLDEPHAYLACSRIRGATGCGACPDGLKFTVAGHV
jgi:hypothetical protein